MINPNYQISPVESADLPFLAKFIHSAKLSLSINRLLYQPWPSKDVQRNQYAKAVEGAFGDSSMESFKATDKESNEIIGYIALAKQTGVQEQPTTPSQDAETSPEQKFPKEMNPGLLAEVSRANTKLKKATEHLDRVELVYICVEPCYQGQGVGSKLLNLGFDRSRAEGVPLVVCAEAPAYGFFEKLRFKEASHVDIDLGNFAPAHSGFGIFRLTSMIWEP